MNKNEAYSPMSEREKEILGWRLEKLSIEEREFLMLYIQTIIDIHTLEGEGNLLKEQNKNLKTKTK